MSESESLPVPANEDALIPERDKPAFAVTAKINQAMLDIFYAGAEGIDPITDSTVLVIDVPNFAVHNSRVPFTFENQQVTLSSETATDSSHRVFDRRLNHSGRLKVTSRTSLTFTDKEDGSKRAFGLSTFTDGGTECMEWRLNEQGEAVGQSPRLEPDSQEFQMLNRFAEAARITAEQLQAPERLVVSPAGRTALNAG